MEVSYGTYGRGENVYKALVGKPEGKKPLGRPGHRWDDNIKIDIKRGGWDGFILLRM